MKTLKFFSLLTIAVAVSGMASAQNLQTETFKVSGNCGMCKSKIEKAAKEAGASSANWSADKQEITVKYSSKTTNTAKIQQGIAGVGYDNAGFQATAEAYNKLHGCCKYERTATAKKESCCSGKCEMKDGKCTDMAACKDKGCCDENGVCKAGSECKHEGHDAKMDCCKDGKCSKEGHKGGDCCKKSH